MKREPPDEIARGHGAETYVAGQPFDVEVTPAELVADR